jgi:hypothetical protein
MVATGMVAAVPLLQCRLANRAEKPDYRKPTHLWSGPKKNRTEGTSGPKLEGALREQ